MLKNKEVLKAFANFDKKQVDKAVGDYIGQAGDRES